MKVNCNLINDEKLLEPIPYDEISSTWLTPPGGTLILRWVPKV